MANSANNMSVSGSNRNSDRGLNENIVQSPTITNDDESTMSIGEIGVDEYFDDIFIYNDVFMDPVTDDSMIGSSSVDELNTTTLPQTSIVNSREINKPIISESKYIQGAAAVNASESIAKSGSKRKRQIDEKDEDKEKRLLIDDLNRMNCTTFSELEDLGINVPIRFYQIYTMDNHFLLHVNFISIVPAKNTVYDILWDFKRKKSIEFGVLDIVLDAFDQVLPCWCFYRIENLQFVETKKKYPNRRLCQLYGLPHLVRFISCLPRVFDKMDSVVFTEMVTEFTKRFLIYMVEEDLKLNLNNDYDNVMPEYHRMTYWPLRTRQLRN